jgi:hypothetical protein
MPKLGIPVGVILALLQLPIALQAVVLLVEKLRNSYIVSGRKLPFSEAARNVEGGSEAVSGWF